jgi:hypothetical protein
MHFSKRPPPPHHMHHHPQHLNINRPVHHPQSVYLSPNPSSGGPQAPPMYYPAPQNGYPHTPNSMAHRETDDDYDSASGQDGMNEMNPYHRMGMAQKYHHPQYHHPQHSQGSFPPQHGDPQAYYSPNLPTPAVSPASSANHPPPSSTPYPPPPASANGHTSPPAGHSATPTSTASQGPHPPTPYQGGAQHPPHPGMHYATAYNNHRLYMTGNSEVEQHGQGYIPRLQPSHSYPSSQNMPIGNEGGHGLGISMANQNMKVETVSTPMGAAW